MAREPVEIRRRIGLTGQFASVDGQLGGRDNLVLIARLLGAGRRAARARADELLELFQLTEVADRRASGYSGGLRRRLDLAVSLVGAPAVLFLDEPTTGLDPSSRLNLWEIVEGLVEQGTTVLLTTQYLEEADRLADSIAVLSAGRVVAAGTAAELKATVGRRTVTLALETGEDRNAAGAALRGAGFAPVVGEEDPAPSSSRSTPPGRSPRSSGPWTRWASRPPNSPSASPPWTTCTWHSPIRPRPAHLRETPGPGAVHRHRNTATPGGRNRRPTSPVEDPVTTQLPPAPRPAAPRTPAGTAPVFGGPRSPPRYGS